MALRRRYRGDVCILNGGPSAEMSLPGPASPQSLSQVAWTYALQRARLAGSQIDRLELEASSASLPIPGFTARETFSVNPSLKLLGIVPK